MGNDQGELYGLAGFFHELRSAGNERPPMADYLDWCEGDARSTLRRLGVEPVPASMLLAVQDRVSDYGPDAVALRAAVNLLTAVTYLRERLQQAGDVETIVLAAMQVGSAWGTWTQTAVPTETGLTLPEHRAKYAEQTDAAVRAHGRIKAGASLGGARGGAATAASYAADRSKWEPEARRLAAEARHGDPSLSQEAVADYFYARATTVTPNRKNLIAYVAWLEREGMLPARIPKSKLPKQAPSAS